MRILFDQGAPVPLCHRLASHEVATSYERGWSTLENGALLDAADEHGFAVLVTTDTDLKHQQNLAARRIAVVALTSTSWPRIERVVEAVVGVIEGVAAGSYTEVGIPSEAGLCESCANPARCCSNA